MNLFLRRDGRLSSPAPLVEWLRASCPELGRFQVVQQDGDRFVLRFTSGAPPDETLARQILSRFRHVLGSRITLRLERVGQIHRTRENAEKQAPTEISW